MKKDIIKALYEVYGDAEFCCIALDRVGRSDLREEFRQFYDPKGKLGYAWEFGARSIEQEARDARATALLLFAEVGSLDGLYKKGGQDE